MTVTFPHTNYTDEKRSYGVIISCDEINSNPEMLDVIVARMTTNIKDTLPFGLIIEPSNIETVTFKKKCMVNVDRVMTVEKKLITRYHGFLPPEIMAELDKLIAHTYSIQISQLEDQTPGDNSDTTTGIESAT